MTEYQQACAAIFYSTLALFGLVGLVIMLTTPPPPFGNHYDISASIKDDDDQSQK